MAKPTIRARLLPDGDPFTLAGRLAWALSELQSAGEHGVTPISTPGPRWSAYVHRLRHEFGVDIETKTEAHQGAFPGHHARYFLRSPVAIGEDASG